MTPESLQHYRDTIAKAAGPAPWYLGQEASDLSTPPVMLTWKRDPSAGPTELIDGGRRIYALTSIYSYVQRISPVRFVVWHKSGTPETGKVHVKLYEISSLQPMSDKQTSLARLTKGPFASAALPVAEYSVPRRLSAGLHRMELPPEFTYCPELFVLVPNDNTWDNVGLNLWTIDHSRHEVRVVPQDWFTNGPYDFGYQWVTRIARSRDSGYLVGDGIRIGTFVLNEDGSEFRQWLAA